MFLDRIIPFAIHLHILYLCFLKLFGFVFENIRTALLIQNIIMYIRSDDG